jgi:hypothetical protein
MKKAFSKVIFNFYVYKMYVVPEKKRKEISRSFRAENIIHAQNVRRYIGVCVLPADVTSAVRKRKYSTIAGPAVAEQAASVAGSEDEPKRSRTEDAAGMSRAMDGLIK